MSTTKLSSKKVAPLTAGRGFAAWKWPQASAGSVVGGGRLKTWQADLFAILATAATFGLRFALEGQLGGQPTAVILALPIMLSAYFGGLRAGLVATACAYLGASYYLMPPVHSFAVSSGGERGLLFVVALAGLCISGLCEMQDRARRRAEIVTGGHQEAVLASEAAQRIMATTRSSILNALPAQIALLDAQGVILSVNEAWRSGAGNALQGEKFGVGQNYREVCRRAHGGCTKDAEDTALGIRQVLGGEVNEFVLEYPCHSPDAQRWFRLMVRPLQESQLAGAVVMQVDITEAKVAEVVQLRLAAVVDSTDDAIIGKTLEGVINSWNRGAEKMFGYSAAEALGKPLLMIFPPERVAEEVAILARLGRGERVKPFETVRVRKDGQRIDISATISPIMDGGGRIVGVSKIARDITQQRQAEAKLREREEDFRTMANSIPQLAWVAHADGSIFWYNDRWFEYTGATLEQMEGWGWQSVHDPEVLPRVIEQWTRAIAAGRTFEMEFPLRGADGKFRRFLTRAQPLKDVSGKVVQWFGTNTDVDALKRVEDSLRKSEASLAAAQLRAKIGNWELDVTMQTGTWSAEMFRLFDRDPALGVPTFPEFKAMLHPDDREAFASLHAATVAAGHANGQDFRVIRPDGSIRWLAGRTEMVQNADGKPGRMIGTTQDITERKLAEEEQTRLLHILEQSLNEIYIFDATSLQFDFVNHAAQTNLGYTREQLAAMTPLDLKPDFTLGRFQELIAPLQSGEEPQQIFETVHLRVDGSLYPVEVHLQLVSYRSRLVFLAMILDITQRKQGENEILRLNAQLEQRVAERTAQLEGANKEMEAFSYSVSHDLRAPLRGVDGYVRMLMEDYGATLDAEGRRMLGVVSSEARRMGQLIDDLLAFSRMGRQKMDRTLIDMTRLVHGEVENLSHAAPASALRFDLQPLPPVEGDAAMLRQVFANLLANAMKFSRQQANPVIEVGSRSGEGEMVFYVKDNGVGFDEKYGHKLFGVFQRLHSEEEFEGTGVGLALVQRVIHRHGGRVWAESKLQHGASFFFTLPTTRQNLT